MSVIIPNQIFLQQCRPASLEDWGPIMRLGYLTLFDYYGELMNVYAVTLSVPLELVVTYDRL
jgi:hypothetical protein